MSGAAAKPTGATQQPMQKNRPNAPPRESASSRRPGQLRPVARIAISLLIVWHFTAIFLAALSVPPNSRLVADVAQQPPIQWYLDLLYLNHGHSFFAPEVGPGHLIRYELMDERGNQINDGRGELPDRKEHWPRLRYHRHFMLADQAGLPSPDTQFRDYWQRKYLESYARHLLRVHDDAQAVRVQRIAHWPLPRELAIQGTKLTDPDGYQLLLEVTQRRSDLQPSPAEQSGSGQGSRLDAAGRWVGGGLR